MSDNTIGQREYLVLAPIEPEAQELTAREMLAPRMYTGGLGSSVHDLVGRTESTIVWFLEWADGLKIAVGIGLGDVPDVESLYQLAKRLSCADTLFRMQPANELPA
jgi:hypothetical protein